MAARVVGLARTAAAGAAAAAVASAAVAVSSPASDLAEAERLLNSHFGAESTAGSPAAVPANASNAGRAPPARRTPPADCPKHRMDPEIPAHWRAEARSRQTASGMRAAFSEEAMRPVAYALGAAFVLGASEASLKSSGRLGAARLRFICTYGLVNVFPSIIWLTAEAPLVASLAGVPSSVVAAASSLTAGTELAAFMLMCARSTLMGFTGIGQILRLTDVVEQAEAGYKRAVLSGDEPMLTGLQGRVVRLAGVSSDVTNLSLQRYGCHVVPVYETLEPNANTIKLHSNGGLVPVAWLLNGEQYGRSASWGGPILSANSPDAAAAASAAAGFQVGRDWLFHVARSETASEGHADQRVLFIEADSSVGEQALALSNDLEKSNDLDYFQAAQGFRAVEKLARAQKSLTADDFVCRILLADGAAELQSPTGKKLTLRQTVEQNKHCDVLIDAKMPLIHAIVQWAATTHASPGSATSSRRRLIFDTMRCDYFETVKQLLEPKGWEVIDHVAAAEAEGVAAAAGLPRLMYYSTTHSTITEYLARLETAQADPGHVCLLLDNAEGVIEIKQLSSERARSVDYICSAEIYDDAYATVRHKVLAGQSTLDVQRDLDRSWAA
eukprot:SAG22_NODE_2059_length_3068_cov_2.731378_2_plen_613_part_00